VKIGKCSAGDGRVEQVRVPGQGADAQLAAVVGDEGELGQPVDVDSTSGWASRSFIIGIRLCPPPGSGPPACSAASARARRWSPARTRPAREPAWLTALRQDLGDQLVSPQPGRHDADRRRSRLLGTASQIVVLGAEAHAAVRAAQGAPEQLRVVATSTFAEFVVGPLMEAFTRRFAGSVEVTTGVAVTGEMAC
jgi:hypothetical protein